VLMYGAAPLLHFPLQLLHIPTPPCAGHVVKNGPAVHLVYMGHGYGNEAGLMNDPLKAPLDTPQFLADGKYNRDDCVGEANAKVAIFCLGGPMGFPVPLAMTTQKVPQRQELLYCYGKEYWKTYRLGKEQRVAWLEGQRAWALEGPRQPASTGGGQVATEPVSGELSGAAGAPTSSGEWFALDGRGSRGAASQEIRTSRGSTGAIGGESSAGNSSKHQRGAEAGATTAELPVEVADFLGYALGCTPDRLQPHAQCSAHAC
jgi:hypothetical protein